MIDDSYIFSFRGQQYFKDNRFGILTSNLFGLLSVLAEPKGLKILNSTGASSTPETARKRYVQTMFHMLSWYENDLTPDSESWKSLTLVRKMHHYASRQSQKKGIGMITQIEVGLTAYGFLGYALTRPHTLGVRYDNDEDRDAFVFFWAVICSMLGVKDEFNMCLHPLPVVEMIVEICRRYIFLQILQLETPMFTLMARAFYDGQSKFLPLMSFESMMFLNKRTAGLPGYQFQVDMNREKMCKQVFTDAELAMIHKHYSAQEGYQYMKDFIIDGRIRILKLRRRDSNKNIISEKYTQTIDYAEEVKADEHNINVLLQLLELEYPDDLQLTVIESDGHWAKHLNDKEFSCLSNTDQMLVKMRIQAFKNNYTWWGYRINDWLVSRILRQMEKYNK